MKQNRLRGFSLVELLLVVAILAVLATVSISAFTSIGRGRSLAKAAADLAGIFELSRTLAMANNTAVRVALTPPSNEEPKLLVQVFEQRPGESNSKSLQRVRAFESITATIDPANLTNFRFNNRGELQTTNAIPIQSLKIDLKQTAASNNATITIQGLTGAISVSQP